MCSVKIRFQNRIIFKLKLTSLSVYIYLVFVQEFRHFNAVLYLLFACKMRSYEIFIIIYCCVPFVWILLFPVQLIFLKSLDISKTAEDFLTHYILPWSANREFASLVYIWFIQHITRYTDVIRRYAKLQIMLCVPTARATLVVLVISKT